MRTWLGHAFTLVELVIVIAIVGILAAIAIPRFVDIRSEAYIAQRDGIVGSVRAGILTAAAQNQVKGCANTFPNDNLEDAWNFACNALTSGILSPDGTVCNAGTPCFELIIPGGYVDAAWTQTTATKYDFTAPVGGGSKQYTYTPGDGTFR